MLAEGQILEDKYRVVRLLARGGMGDVYLGVNERLGKSVAIKILQAEHAHDPVVVDRFEQEARVGAMIHSAHIADVYDFGKLPAGERFMVMELLEGEDLGYRLERERSIPEDVLAAMTLQILDALASAHGAGVVHRDLKPENLFVTQRDGRPFVKLVDFGISKVVTSNPHESTRRLTLAGSIVGTPLYMSPEQARGKGVDHRSDLYSLGVILYEAALGQPPFTGENVNDLLFRVALENATPLELRLPSVSPELAAIVKKAMARLPGDRFQSAEEMRGAVLEWQASVAGGAAKRASSSSSFPSFEETALRPWSRTPSEVDGDEEDADAELTLELRARVARGRSKGWLAAAAVVCGLVALGVTHPQQVKTVSSEVALRATPLWRDVESKAVSAMAPAQAQATATATVASATVVAPKVLPSAEPVPAVVAPAVASPVAAAASAAPVAAPIAPKPMVAAPRAATPKRPAPEKKASPPGEVHEAPPASAGDGPDEDTAQRGSGPSL